MPSTETMENKTNKLWNITHILRSAQYK